MKTTMTLEKYKYMKKANTNTKSKLQEKKIDNIDSFIKNKSNKSSNNRSSEFRNNYKNYQYDYEEDFYEPIY